VVAIQPRDADEIDPGSLKESPGRFGGAILKDSVMKLGKTLIRTSLIFGPMAFALTLSASTPGHADDYGSCGPNCACPPYDDSSSCTYDYPYGFYDYGFGTFGSRRDFDDHRFDGHDFDHHGNLNNHGNDGFDHGGGMNNGGGGHGGGMYYGGGGHGGGGHGGR
jgi:hypothetical protein